MARKRKRRGVAATTATTVKNVVTKTSSKSTTKEAMASLTSALPVPPTAPSTKTKLDLTSKERLTTSLATKEEKLDSIISQTEKIISEEAPKSQSPITAASCRRKQAKPQRKNGESYFFCRRGIIHNYLLYFNN